jgi:hypothetical protein
VPRSTIRPIEDDGSRPGKVDDCELCEAARFTPWFHEDEICWVAECESCSVPMVVWTSHGTEPPEDDLAHMLAVLERVGREQLGADATVDRVMRQVPDHFHAHARDPNRWSRQFPW